MGFTRGLFHAEISGVMGHSEIPGDFASTHRGAPKARPGGVLWRVPQWQLVKLKRGGVSRSEHVC